MQSGQPVPLELEELTVGYKNKAVLSHLNLTAGSGELLALIGPNGAGKTTLLKTIAGLRKPLSGSVLIDGKDVSGLKPQKRAGYMSFLFQGNTADWSFTVREIVSQGRLHLRGFGKNETKADKECVEKALSEADLTGLAEKPITELSGGEFQRALIARTIAQETKILLLDEPVNNLDPKYAFLIMELVKKLTRKGVTALVSLHDLNLASLYADRIGIAANGTFAAGSPGEMTGKNLLEKTFGINFFPFFPFSPENE